MAKPKKEIISNDPAEDIAPISIYGAVEYSVDPKTLESLAKLSAGIKEVNSAKDVAAIMPYIAALRENRVTINSERKVLKEGVLQHGKLVDTEAKALIDIIQPEEQRLQAIRKKFEDAAALVKQKKIEAERVRTDAHRENIQKISDLPGRLIADKASADELGANIMMLKKVDLSQYEEFESQAGGAVDTALAVIGMAFNLAEKAEVQAELDAENEAKAKDLKEAQDAVDAEKLANHAEFERLKQEKIDQEAKVEQDKIDALHKKAEDEEAAKQKIIDDEIAANKKIFDDKAAADQAEADKIADEIREKDRLADIELAKPDVKKLIEFAAFLVAIEVPELPTSPPLKTRIEKDIEDIAAGIIVAAKTMVS